MGKTDRIHVAKIVVHATAGSELNESLKLCAIKSMQEETIVEMEFNGTTYTIDYKKMINTVGIKGS